MRALLHLLNRAVIALACPLRLPELPVGHGEEQPIDCVPSKRPTGAMRCELRGPVKSRARFQPRTVAIARDAQRGPAIARLRLDFDGSFRQFQCPARVAK